MAQGTIPAEAKIYPIVDDNLTMEINYEDVDKSIFSKKDIAEIVTKQDKYDALCFNNAAKDYDTSEQSFCSVQSIIENNNAKKSYTVLNGAQILTIDFKSENSAETLTLVKSTGTIGDKEDTYYTIGQIWWEKQDGEWRILGSATGFTGAINDWSIARDTVSGQIKVLEKQQA